jgi:hypothetical protein
MTVMRSASRVNTHTRHYRGTVSDESSGGSGDAATVVHGKTDVVLDDVTGPTDTTNVARHIQGDLSVKGTLVANKVVTLTTYGTCDPKSKGPMKRLSPAEVAAEMGKLQFFAYESKHDPGFRRWGYHAGNVEQLSGGNFVRSPEQIGFGEYTRVDFESINAGSNVLVMELWRKTQALEKELRRLQEQPPPPHVTDTAQEEQAQDQKKNKRKKNKRKKVKKQRTADAPERSVPARSRVRQHRRACPHPCHCRAESAGLAEGREVSPHHSHSAAAILWVH